MAKIFVLAGFADSLLNFRGPLLKEMLGLGHQVVTCAPEDDPDIVARLKDIGVRHLSVPFKRSSIDPIGDLGLFVRLLRLLRRERVDYFLAYTGKPVVYGLLAAAVARVPHRYVIITGLGYAFVDGAKGYRRHLAAALSVLYRLSLRYANGVFFQNPDDQREFVARGLLSDPGKATRVWGSGVDLGHFSTAKLPTTPPIFLLIARLLKDKGIEEYVAAARCLRTTHPEVRCQLLGPYDSNPAAISPKDVNAWVAEGVIEYLGESKDVRPLIAQCSVYVLPSYREGTPRTVLEAMAMGRPIITTDAPGCRETVIGGQNGFLIPARDVDALVAAMTRFVREPELIPVMGENSRRIAEDRFDVRNVNATILGTMGLA